MTKAAHQLFKRIVLHNKLLPEAELDALLAQVDDPEKAVAQLVQERVLTDKKAEQLLAVYRKQLDKLFLDQLELGDLQPPAGKEKTPPPTEKHAPDRSHPEAAPAPAAQKPPPDVAAAPADERPPPVTAEAPAGPAIGLRDTGPLPAGGVPLVHRLLQDAREVGASDLHLKSGEVPVVRVNGTLRELPRPRIAGDVCEQSLLAILNDEQRAQFLATWDLDFCYDGGSEMGRFRANLLRQHRGTDAIFRLIPARLPTFEELHLPEQVMKFTDYRVGMVLVTGPKGCGKTTTLAAMVDRINSSRAEHIITVEDPIEFVQPCKKGHVNQRQVGVHTQSFSNALRSALREAPDVIMVGEMRDLETTSLAITASETGHLVLATLHTPDAIRTIGRILDVFPPKEQSQIRAMVSESLRGICSQLLLPSRDGQTMELALEILVNTPAIGHLIREEKVHQIRGLMQTGKQYGMVLMDESLVRLAKAGRISKQTAMSRADDVKFVDRELSEVE
jgi:twitching motility protein PilT